MSGRDLKAMKYDIPSKVRIANHWYKVILCDFIDNGDTFGSHCNLKLEIKVAECMKTDDGETVNLTEEQINLSGMKYSMHLTITITMSKMSR